MSDAAQPADPHPSLEPDGFHHEHPLDELLADADPLGSVDELLIDELTDDEADAFLAAIAG